MKTGQKYIQVFVDGKNGLPNDGKYQAHIRNTPNDLLRILEYQTEPMTVMLEHKLFWLANVDWYLLPVKDSLRDELQRYEKFWEGMSLIDFGSMTAKERIKKYLSTLQPEKEVKPTKE